MNDYTPTTERVRFLYGAATRWKADDDPARPDLTKLRHDQLDEFDRWLAREKSNTLQEFRARLIQDQIEQYGIVLPDVHEVIDALAIAADKLDPT